MFGAEAGGGVWGMNCPSLVIVSECAFDKSCVKGTDWLRVVRSKHIEVHVLYCQYLGA